MIIDIPLAAVIVLFTIVVCAFMYMLGRIVKCNKAECCEVSSPLKANTRFYYEK